MFKPPHDFGQAGAMMRLASLPDEIAANTQRFLSGKLDDNLAVIFNSLSLGTLEQACLQLFYGEASVEEILDLLGQSAQAQANKFRLLGDGKSQVISITWAGVTREFPGQRSIGMHNTLGIPAALIHALLADRREDLAFLANLPQENMKHSDILQPEETLRFTAYLQGLFGGKMTGEGQGDLEWEMGQLYSDVNLKKSGIHPEADANVAYSRAYVQAYFDLGKQMLRKNEKHHLSASLNALLTAHQALFDSEKDNLRWSIPGLLCFHALGICALAKKAGIELVCDNAYAPQALLTRIHAYDPSRPPT